MALQDLAYKDRHWHSECFLCAKCSRSLVERPFATKEDLLMCVECYSNEFSAKCHACLKTIMPGRSAQNPERRADGGRSSGSFLAPNSSRKVPFRNGDW